MMRVLDLFSGIGGFSLGLERAGAETAALCEIDPFCREVLRRRWPSVPIYEDVRELTADTLSRDGIAVDAICGGFPCQDISVAGDQAGMDGERSGLWAEIARLVGEVRPRFVFVENVAALLSGDGGRWFGRVLGDLAAIGYDAEWHCIPASDFGAEHRRERIWIVAYPHGDRHPDFAAAIASFPFAQACEQWDRRLDELGSSDGVERCDSYAGIRRAVHGISDWAHRLRSLGNAVTPITPHLMGLAVTQSEHVPAQEQSGD